MYLTKKSYSKNKFEEYSNRRHKIITKLTPMMRFFIDEQNVYGYNLTRLNTGDKEYLPIKLTELYGFTEYRTRDIVSLLSSQENTKTFSARINKLDIPRKLIFREDNMTVDYLFSNGLNKKSVELPSQPEIIDSVTTPPRLRDRIGLYPESVAMNDINIRLRQFEISIGANILKSMIDHNR